MTVEELVSEKLKAEGVTLVGADLAAVTTWYSSYATGRTSVEAMLSLTDEPAVVFNALGKASS
ncbi:hypothetical protein AYO38_08330 [bacterium SCGC AG-212-C10]|nr:hypothetical protein AYO38_08330 [bacterium SCGC AG-212-C10]